jgi:uncharacterized repeat protein (TIGR02543 family)
MKNAKQALALILTVALLFLAWPGIPAFAGGNFFVPPEQPSADLDDNGAFVPGEVLATANSLQHAQEIAAAYGLRVKSYAYGIAVLTATDAEGAVAQSKMVSMGVSLVMGIRSAIMPALGLNRVYQISEDAYGPASPDYEYMHTRMPYKPATSYSGSWLLASDFWRPQDHSGAADGDMQWHHIAMDSEKAWTKSTGKDVLVAVIDTGIDIDHPDFSGRISAKSYNSHTLQEGLEYVRDDYGHGTHVSGILAGARSKDVSGAAPDVQIIAIKANRTVMPDEFTADSLLRAINYAVENGAKIINMSLGRDYSQGEDQLEHDVLAKAVAGGVTVVCAAGNRGYDHASYPAAYPEAIAVSATGQDGLFYSAYSNYGPEVDIAAPGENIYTTGRGGGYAYHSGTSMAAPNVAGAAALVLALHPAYSPQQVRDVLCQTARDAGEAGKDDYYGYGIVNSYAALLGPAMLHSVSYDFNDGTRAPVTVKVIPGDKLTEPDGKLAEPDAPLREGYAFSGWFIKDTDKRFGFADVITENLHLYAKWAEVKPGMNITEFPDRNFRRIVLRKLNSEDGGLRTDADIMDEDDEKALAAFTELNIANMNISDICGLEYFSGLKTFSCDYNQLTKLDMSQNTALVELYCGDNQLRELDVSVNTKLIELDCGSNQLTKLDVATNTALEALSCSYNKIGKLDMSTNTELEHLFCNENQLTELDVSKNTKLQTLWCEYNRLTELDVTNKKEIKILKCDRNQLTALDVTANTALVYLDCGRNQLSKVDVSKNTGLKTLWCNDNKLTKLDVSENTGLKVLACGGNQLTELDVSKNTELGLLYCDDNKLSSLDIAKNTALADLRLNKNQLSNLDLSTNTALEFLGCADNQLAELVVSKNTALRYLGCGGNQLTALDVADNTALWYLHCSGNQLGKLDVAQNTELRQLWCAGNRLAVLDVNKNINLLGYYYVDEDDGLYLEAGLDCSDNLLAGLDLSKNADLMILLCNDNKLKALDISNNPELRYLECRRNYMVSTGNVIGWQKNGLAIDKTFFFDPQNPVITITAQPTATITVPYDNITGSLNITASVTPEATLRYQWYRNTMASATGGSLITGATSTAYAIPQTLAAGTYYFYCVVSAIGAESVTSTVATVTVVQIMSVTAQPADTTVKQGSISGSLGVTAIINPKVELCYQWYSNTTASASGGTLIVGAIYEKYEIPKDLKAGTYFYYCRVSATADFGVNSNVVAVKVQPADEPALPPGGGFGGAVVSPNATISPAKADFDINGGKDILVSLNRNGLTLKALKNGANTLKAGTDYAASGNTVNIKASYLATLAVGAQTIVFEMSGGTNPQLAVTIKDTTILEEPEIPLAQPNSFAPYIQGFEDSTFRGDLLMTREQFITILFRLKNAPSEPQADKGKPSFKDVDSARWSYDAIEWAKKEGLITAFSDGCFRPAQALTRAQMAVILVKSDNLKDTATNAFSDLAGHADRDDILKAVQANIFTGYPDGTFKPEGFSTRNEAVTALTRYLLGQEPTDELWQNIDLSFTDVSKSFWAYKYIALAVNGM